MARIAIRRGLVLAVGVTSVVAITVACGGGSATGGSGSGGGQGGASAATSVTVGSGASLPDGGIAAPHCPAPASGARVFYVDGANGSDSASGTSESAAWKTIGRALGGGPVGPGDTVMIKGGLYRERVDISVSGAPGKPIVVRPFDDKEVIVDASNAVGGWTVVSGSIYKAHPGFAVQAVVAGDTPLFPVKSMGALGKGTYFVDGSGDLYVWLNDGSAPTADAIGVLKVDDDKSENGLSMYDKESITICGLTVRYAASKGIIVNGKNHRVEQCRIVFNGDIGTTVYSESGGESSHAAFVENEIAYNFMRNWPRCANGYKYGGWGTGVSSQGSPDTELTGNYVHHNGGEGIVVGGSTGAKVEGNVSFDNWSVDIYALNTTNVTIAGNFVYSDPPDLGLLKGNGDPSPNDGECEKRLRPDGIDTGDEDNGDPTLFDGAAIVNNIIVGCRNGYAHVDEVDASGIKDVTFAFNTIVLPSQFKSGDTIIGLDIEWNNGRNDGSTFRDNIVYAPGGDSYLLSGATDPGGGNLFQGLSIDHNLWFSATAKSPIHWGKSFDDLYTPASWAKLPGAHAAGDVTKDPKLGAMNGTDPKAFCPDAGSPAIDKGIDAQVGTDFFGKKRPAGGGFDLGACEVSP